MPLPQAPMPVWVWYEYPNDSPSRYIQLNLQALKRHSPPSHFKLIFVNRSTIALHVPDLPDAFWRLPTRVAFSDAGRLALLATHGGIYLDADFLVLRSLVLVADLLQRVDVVGYPFSPPHGVAESSAKCAHSGRLSANFLASRPNASLFRQAWDTFRGLLPRRCSGSRLRKVFICCRDPASNEPLEKCRVPHATTDLMMSRVRHRIWPELPPASSPAAAAVVDNVTRAKVYCFGGSDDLTTPRLQSTGSDGKFNGKALHEVLGIPVKSLRLCYGKWRLLGRALGCQTCVDNNRLVCCRRDGDDLVCHSQTSGRGEARAAGFYARTRLAYHLFDSFQRDAFKLQKTIEWSNLTVAPLYRRALGLSND